MATEEGAPVSAPAPVLDTIPQYPELILAAIEGGDDKNGVNKTTISKHIESVYGQLPAAHSTLLSHHLNRMRQSGLILPHKNNFIKPDPNAPPRRGRGRPPKESSTPAPDAVVSPPRPRGRPPKAVDPEKTKTPSESGRKRGRPKKSEVDAPPSGPTSGPSRGRGRPPKVKRGRGRPPKAEAEAPTVVEAEAPAVAEA